MFFLGLTFSFVVIGVGIVLLVKSSYVIGSLLVGLGMLFLIAQLHWYRSKSKKRHNDKSEKGSNNSWDCYGFPDCGDSFSGVGKLMKKFDCDCDGLDCDCSPDCSI